jgi:hypothetical protein
MRRDDLGEAESPFLFEALEPAANAEGEEELIASFARVGRRVHRRGRAHVERALARHLADRGTGDRRALARAVARLRRRMSETGEDEAFEVVDEALTGCGGGSACRCHASEEALAESDDARECESEEEAPFDPELEDGESADFAAEDSETADSEWEAVFEAFENDEAGDELEMPFLLGEDESEEYEEEAAEDESPFAEVFGRESEVELESDASASEELAGLNELYEALGEAEDEEVEQAEEAEAYADVELESEAPSSAEQRACSDAVVIKDRKTLALPQAPNPFDLNAIASKNTPSKRSVFKALQKTWLALRSVDKQIAKKSTAKLQAKRKGLVERRDQQAEALRSWVRAHPVDHSRKRTQLSKAIAALEKKLRKLKGKAREAAQTELGVRKGALTTYEGALRAAANAYEPLKDVAQTYYAVEVPGRAGTLRVQLHDHVIAYATDTRGGFEGNATADSRTAVADALARAGISTSKQSMLRVLSSLEGQFSNVNTWDRAVVTFGFIQWTTGETGDGTLCKLMAAIRSASPDTYRRRFQCHGLDLAGKLFKLTRPGEPDLVGGEAARFVQTSVKHVAALSAAGMDPDVQAAQIRYAVEGKIDGMLARTVAAKGRTLRLGELLTSDYAVAVMMDRATGNGEGGTRDAAQRGFTAYMKQHPTASLAGATERAAAGARVLAAIEALDPERAGKYAALSREPGSFSA